MGMTAMLAEAWKRTLRRRRQRLAFEELVRMAPHRRDELGIDLVDLGEGTVRLSPQKGQHLRPCPDPIWERGRSCVFSGKAG